MGLATAFCGQWPSKIIVCLLSFLTGPNPKLQFVLKVSHVNTPYATSDLTSCFCHSFLAVSTYPTPVIYFVSFNSVECLDSYLSILWCFVGNYYYYYYYYYYYWIHLIRGSHFTFLVRDFLNSASLCSVFRLGEFWVSFVLKIAYYFDM